MKLDNQKLWGTKLKRWRADYASPPMIVVVMGVGVLLALILSYVVFFGAPGGSAAPEQFVVARGTRSNEVPDLLEKAGFIRYPEAFRVALKLQEAKPIPPGGYLLSKSMSAWEVASVFSHGPIAKWVVIPEGVRKEEVADLLQSALGWSDMTKNDWVITYTNLKFDYVEGVYFPETYLIPIDEVPLKVAERLQAKFNEVFKPLGQVAIEQNIKWDTALKVASIVQREAAGKLDMPLIAGVIWNRLLKGMKLEIDATVQYARGKTDKGWWAPIKISDKQIDSPYNTYRYAGLPPHPISNPGLAAIKAALAPQQTKCLYYIHDRVRTIHCAVTYQEQLRNVELYLK